VAHQLEPVGIVGWKATAEVGLSAGTAEDLLVGGEQFHPAAWMNRALHAW